MNLFTLYEVYPIQSCKCPTLEPELNCTHPSKDEYRMVEIFDTREDAELVLKALNYAKDDTLYKIQENIPANTSHHEHDCGCEDCLFSPTPQICECPNPQKCPPECMCNDCLDTNEL